VDQEADTVTGSALSTIVGGSETILIVEDDADVRILVEEILKSVGYHVLSTEGSEEAVQIAREYPKEIQLLITDVVLKNIGGRENAERLTQLRPNMQVLFMSGYTSDAILKHGILGRDFHFIPKPFTLEGLCSNVRSVLDSRQPIRQILIVDDDASIRELLATSLEAAGYSVVTASSARQAKIHAAEYPIDLMITDLAMPDEEGIELLRDLRKEHGNLKIIVISGAFGTGVLQAARLLGADATLSKPLTPATVLQCIDEVALKPPRR
jgi:DNA-binding NtrC family response regulator